MLSIISVAAKRLPQIVLIAAISVSCWCGMGIPSQRVMAAAETPSGFTQLQEQVESLQELVNRSEWFEVQSYIHGPMGLVRKQLGALTLSLSPSQRKAVQQDLREIPLILERIDAAATDFSTARLDGAQNDLVETVNRIEAVLGSA